MFKKLFGLKEKKRVEVLVAPLSGKVMNLEEVPDPVFSQLMMGDGLAIVPTEGKVVSPVDGEIVQFFPTKHAIGLLSDVGVEILIHVGLETVHLKGEGFEGHVEVGDQVKAGDLLLSFDLDLIKEKAKSTITPIVITNGDVVESLEKMIDQVVVHGSQTVMTIKTK
ncbi:PTS glucose transporter subunit IIA [Ammoniphilus sp. YIM 78166]|uniref:PTS sugar transporter subunit IIA n=1 Tax=Ammoniphilus sp. YIM 78166 TaxID=1644106 RepID=UPI00106F9B10|nr:PTS glucose transporter subunit IIA [Ammoniphilus sp. YIM 78166]